MLSQVAALMLAGAIIGATVTLHRQQLLHALQAAHDLINLAVLLVPVLRIVCAPHTGHHTRRYLADHPDNTQKAGAA